MRSGKVGRSEGGTLPHRRPAPRAWNAVPRLRARTRVAGMDPTTPRVHPQQTIAVYAESLAAGGTVALFGDSSLGLAALLLELGASAVHVLDPDPRRAHVQAERAPEGVT